MGKESCATGWGDRANHEKNVYDLKIFALLPLDTTYTKLGFGYEVVHQFELAAQTNLF